MAQEHGSDGCRLRIAVMLSPSPRAGDAGIKQFIGVYYALQEAEVEVLVASKTGGYPWQTPPKQPDRETDELAKRFRVDHRARDDLANSIQFVQLFVEDFHGGFCIGDPGAIWRDTERHSAGTLIAQFLRAGKPVAVQSSLIDIIPNGPGGGLLILCDGTWPPPAAVAALLAAVR